jgi:hypothetical protein
VAQLVKPQAAKVGRIAIIAIETAPESGQGEFLEKPSKHKPPNRTLHPPATCVGQCGKT